MIKEVIRGEAHTEAIDFVMETCCNCHVPFFMPTQMRRELLADKERIFYCPNGHPQHYTGKTEAEKLKDRLAALEKESQQKEQALYDRLREAEADKKQLTILLKHNKKKLKECKKLTQPHT